MILSLRIPRPRYTLLTLIAFTLISCAPSTIQSIEELPANQPTNSSSVSYNQNPWWQAAQSTLQERLNIQARQQRAKNVILFIGDGMGPSTVTAARIFDGQSRGASGEENILSFERFPYTGLVKTYNVDSQVPDSAGTASAMNTGIKTLISAINIWHDKPFDCYGATADFPRTLAQRAETLGMSTGIVTTARVTHATPAAVYAHVPDRNWEDDSAIPDQNRLSGCHDIARQLIEFNHGNGIDLILGGGRNNFLPTRLGGRRLDGRNLLKEWTERKTSGIYIENASQLRALTNNQQPLLGLFTESHMAYETDRDDSKEPALAEMTRYAINQLASNDQGYFLMIEGARIDHAHHLVNAHRALKDAQAFANAVQAAVDLVNLEDTLILVTADHSHVFTLSGYPVRGNPITGLVRQVNRDNRKPKSEYQLAADGKPFTTLGYHNGSNPRLPDSPAITQEQAIHPDFNQQSAMSLEFETHGGEDVAIYAIGPRAHLVGGVIEQNVIFHIMAHALGW